MIDVTRDGKAVSLKLIYHDVTCNNQKKWVVSFKCESHEEMAACLLYDATKKEIENRIEDYVENERVAWEEYENKVEEVVSLKRKISRLKSQIKKIKESSDA